MPLRQYLPHFLLVPNRVYGHFTDKTLQPSAEKTDCLGGEKDVPYQAGKRTRFRVLRSTLLHLPGRAIWQRGAASSAASQRWVRWAGSKPWVKTGGCHQNSLREPTECVAHRSPKRSTDQCHFPRIGSHMAPIILRPVVRSQYLPPGFGAAFAQPPPNKCQQLSSPGKTAFRRSFGAGFRRWQTTPADWILVFRSSRTAFPKSGKAWNTMAGSA
jgi:hypothetical protein